jgi:hypothetical protein
VREISVESSSITLWCHEVDIMSVVQHTPKMAEDFIADDHDHDVSVCSLSVQIFTVPSLVGRRLKMFYPLRSSIFCPSAFPQGAHSHCSGID